MNQTSFHMLVSPPFLAGLFLLLLNDLILKQQFPNEFTGKLSDFAGLFIFPIFWAAFFPRLKTSLYILTAISFIFWKSVLAQPLIDAVNLLLPLSIGRTVDMTDLAALLVLPVSYLYISSGFRDEVKRGVGGSKRRRLEIYAVGLVSVFAFTATSYKDDQSISYNKEYEFNFPRDELIRRLYETDLKHVGYLRLEENPALYSNSEDRDLYTGFLSKKICKSGGMAFMNAYSHGVDKSALKLEFIQYRCDTKLPEHERELIEEFEREVVDKLSQPHI
ncbi:MAG: hypothetical protein ND895_24150 [Pyrinomonadaceae bacterium]|nr:hypothetical protein [Pyrinomonadaceae bacterium]